VLEGGQQGGLSGHHIDQGSGLAFMDAQNSQLRVQAGARWPATFTRAPDNGVVGSANPEDQAAQQTDTAGA
jgi:hypothetical protein